MRWFLKCGAACLAVLASLGAHALSLVAPEPFPASNTHDTYFGAQVADPYRLLEDLKNPDVQQWMRAHADYARALLDTIPHRQALFERAKRYDDAVAARVHNVRRRPGELFFYEKRGATDNQFKLYLRRGLRGTEQLLVDPDTFAKTAGGAPHAINYFEPSWSGRYLAYGVSAAGSEDAQLYVLDVASGKRVLGPISRAQFAEVAWLPDDSGFFFNRLQAMKPGMQAAEKYQKSRVLFVRIDQNSGDDVERAPSVLAFDSPGVQIDAASDTPVVFPVPNTRWALGRIYHGTDREATLYIAPLADAIAGRATWRKIVDRSDGVVGFETVGERLFVLTHNKAPRFRVLETALTTPTLASAREVIPQSAGVLTGLVHAADGLYVSRRDGTASRLFLLSTEKSAEKTARPVEVKLPFAGSFELAGIDHRLPGALITLQNWIREPQIYRVQHGRAANTGLQPRTKYGALHDYVARDVLVKSHDGALVPLSIIHKRGLKFDGRNPTLLWGYASYGVTEEPWFSLWRLAWLERGGVFAVANPRGSGAFGQDWYKAGFQQTKPNTWRDFIACAEYLVQQKITAPAKLGIWGGSAGGITVGRALTERPDLFAAAVISVGALDMLRAELTPNGVPNIPEFGTHTTQAGFNALLAMSTYHHIRGGVRYPAVLFTHGVNDPRVDVWHSTKTAARLLQAGNGSRPVLLRLDYEAGHGVGDTKAQRQQERADVMAFLLWQFGL